MSTGLDIFDRTVQESNLWLKAVMDRLETADRHRAYEGQECQCALSHGGPRCVVKTCRPRRGREDRYDVSSRFAKVLAKLHSNRS